MVRIALVSLLAFAVSALAAPTAKNNGASNANDVDDDASGGGNNEGGLNIQGVEITAEELQALDDKGLLAAKTRLEQLASLTPANPDAFKKQAEGLQEKARDALNKGSNNGASNANDVDDDASGGGNNEGGLNIQGVEITAEELQALDDKGLLAAKTRLEQLASLTPANPDAFKKQAEGLQEKARDALNN